MAGERMGPGGVPGRPGQTPGAVPGGDGPSHQPDRSGGVPPTVDNVSATGGRTIPGARLPEPEPVVSGTLVTRVEKGWLMTPFEGYGTLYDGREQDRALDLAVSEGGMQDRVTALTFPKIFNGEQATVIDIHGSAVDDLLETAAQSRMGVDVIPVSVARGGVFDYLTPRGHGRAAAVYGEYADPSDIEYVKNIGGEIAEVIASVRAQAQGIADPKTIRLTTGEIYDGYRVVRGAAGGLDDVKLETSEVMALLKSKIIAEQVKTTSPVTLDAMGLGLAKLIRYTEGDIIEPSTAGDYRVASARVFTPGIATGEVDLDNALRRVLAQAAPELARVMGGYVVVTDAQRFGKNFAKMFPAAPGRGIVDLLFNVETPEFAEILDSVGLRGDLYVGQVSDGHLADKLSAKFGMRERTGPTGVTISGGYSAGASEGDSRGNATGGGGSKSVGGEMGTNTSANYGVSIQAGKIEERVIRPEDLTKQTDWAGYLRYLSKKGGTRVTATTIEAGQEPSLVERPRVVTPEVEEALQRSAALAAAALRQTQLESAQRQAALRQRVGSADIALSKIELHHAEIAFDTYRGRVNATRREQGLRPLSDSQFKSMVASGALQLGSEFDKYFRRWTTETKKGQEWMRRHARQQQIRDLAQKRAASSDQQPDRPQSALSQQTPPRRSGREVVQATVGRIREVVASANVDVGVILEKGVDLLSAAVGSPAPRQRDGVGDGEQARHEVPLSREQIRARRDAIIAEMNSLVVRYYSDPSARARHDELNDLLNNLPE